jgi:hypothetical protein
MSIITEKGKEGNIDMTEKEFFKIMDGMEDVYREMTAEIERKAPYCHFRKMSLEQSDSIDGYYTEWWECSVCGHTKNL